MAKSKKSRGKTQAKTSRTLLALGALLVVTLLAVGLVTLWPSAGTTVTLPPEISVAEAAGKWEDGVYLLDVREPNEWIEGHVPDSTLIPLGELASRVSELPTDQEIMVICRSGNRSATGRDILLEAGLTQATSVAGGIRAWESAGHPVVSGP
jgi:rhodanese-related sulfurtransferase